MNRTVRQCLWIVWYGLCLLFGIWFGETYIKKNKPTTYELIPIESKEQKSVILNDYGVDISLKGK